MNPLGLTADALAGRRKYVQAGDAAKIMAGEWRQVWREKMGLVEAEDLSGKLPVQMGSYTEPFNLAWCEKMTGREILYFSGSILMRKIWHDLVSRPADARELQISQIYPFMAANLDGMTTTARGAACVIDAKHVGQAGDQVIMRYTAAGTHQATVMETDYWALSVFIGNGKWEYIEQPIDEFYQADLVARCREFWGYVERGEEPEDRLEPTLPPAPKPKLRSIIVPNQTDEVFAALVQQNNWLPEACKQIRTFIDTDGAAKVNAISRDELKKIVPEDVGELRRGRFKLHRDKAGAVRMSLAKMEDDDEVGR